MVLTQAMIDQIAAELYKKTVTMSVDLLMTEDIGCDQSDIAALLKALAEKIEQTTAHM